MEFERSSGHPVPHAPKTTSHFSQGAQKVPGPTFVQTGVNPEILVSLEPLVGLWCQRRPQIPVYSTWHKSQFSHDLLPGLPGRGKKCPQEPFCLPSVCQCTFIIQIFPPPLRFYPQGAPASKSVERIPLLLPNRPAFTRPPPAGVFTDLNLKSGFWGRFGGEKYVLQPLVGARLAQRFHPGRRIFLDLAKHLGHFGGASPLEFLPTLTFSDQLLRKRE